jgi:hypothetical protein
MDMEIYSNCPLFWKTRLKIVGAIIDMKELIAKFHFPHKKAIDHFPRNKLKGFNYLARRGTQSVE